jgi:hypothetical protein
MEEKIEGNRDVKITFHKICKIFSSSLGHDLNSNLLQTIPCHKRLNVRWMRHILFLDPWKAKVMDGGLDDVTRIGMKLVAQRVGVGVPFAP